MTIPSVLEIKGLDVLTRVKSWVGVFPHLKVDAIYDDAQFNTDMVGAYAPYVEESGLDFKAALEVARQRDVEASLALAGDFNQFAAIGVANNNSVNR